LFLVLKFASSIFWQKIKNLDAAGVKSRSLYSNTSTLAHKHACRTLESMAPNTRAAANWAFTRVVALLKFWALIAGVCLLLLWQVVAGVCVLLLWHTVKCACRLLDSMVPHPRAPPGADNWAVERATALPEIWTLVAEHSGGLVGAWRLTGVCKAAREGAKVWLRTLPGLVVCGGVDRGGQILQTCAWRLDLEELRWEHTSDLALARAKHACCAVRGGVVVVGGLHTTEEDLGMDDSYTASVEIFGYESETEEQIFALPPLSCGPRVGTAAVAIEESESEEGQVLLIGGGNGLRITSEVHKVDLATGVCTPLPPLLSHQRKVCTAARLPDGRVVCVGKNYGDEEGITAEVLEELPNQGPQTNAASWRWRELPGMSVARAGCGGCVLSDGRFAVFGGIVDVEAVLATRTTACEVLTLDGGAERWRPLPPMYEARAGFACAAVGGCVIVAGGVRSGGSYSFTGTVEVYEEALGQWRRLPCSLPHNAGVGWMGSALV
jgi:hypothetical protein